MIWMYLYIKFNDQYKQYLFTTTIGFYLLLVCLPRFIKASQNILRIQVEIILNCNLCSWLVYTF